jgi:hypothetical protein
MRTREFNQTQRASARNDFSRSRHLHISLQCSRSVNISRHPSYFIDICRPPLSRFLTTLVFIDICTPHAFASQPGICLPIRSAYANRSQHLHPHLTLTAAHSHHSQHAYPSPPSRSPVDRDCVDSSALSSGFRCNARPDRNFPPDISRVRKSIGPLLCSLPWTLSPERKTPRLRSCVRREGNVV